MTSNTNNNNNSTPQISPRQPLRLRGGADSSNMSDSSHHSQASSWDVRFEESDAESSMAASSSSTNHSRSHLLADLRSHQLQTHIQKPASPRLSTTTIPKSVASAGGGGSGGSGSGDATDTLPHSPTLSISILTDVGSLSSDEEDDEELGPRSGGPSLWMSAPIVQATEPETQGGSEAVSVPVPVLVPMATISLPLAESTASTASTVSTGTVEHDMDSARFTMPKGPREHAQEQNVGAAGGASDALPDLVATLREQEGLVPLESDVVLETRRPNRAGADVGGAEQRGILGHPVQASEQVHLRKLADIFATMEKGHWKRALVILLSVAFTVVLAVSLVPTTERTPQRVMGICEQVRFARKLPMCSGGSAAREAKRASKPPPPNFFELMKTETTMFDKLFRERKANKKSVKELGRTSTTMRDLLIRLKVQGDGMKSKEPLRDALVEFVDDARSTAKALQKLDTRVDFTIQEIIYINNWALASIQESKASAPVPGSVYAYPPLSLLAPSPEDIEKEVNEAFTHVMDHATSQLKSLLMLTHISDNGLNSLAQKLDTIHEIALREKKDQGEKETSISSDIFYKIFNSDEYHRQMDDVRDVRALLNDVLRYKDDARAFINRVLGALNEMEEHLTELRTRTMAPALMGVSGTAELHIMSIQAGIRKLKSIQTK